VARVHPWPEFVHDLPVHNRWVCTAPVVSRLARSPQCQPMQGADSITLAVQNPNPSKQSCTRPAAAAVRELACHVPRHV